MGSIKVLIAAAGRGTRARLPYPKTLYPVQGKPILIRIIDLLAPYDSSPTVVVSPDGRALVAECLAANGRPAYLVEQSAPRGMGDAVLQFGASPAFASAVHVLLMWGDIPLLQPQTVEATVQVHLINGNDLTFATRHVDAAYTVVTRDCAGKVIDLTESRETGVRESGAGERDIGLFVFRRDVVLDALRGDDPGKFGRATGEHGFLYIVGNLVRNGFKVEAVPCATELDLVSLNSIEDLKNYA